jgi:hypothetical protein
MAKFHVTTPDGAAYEVDAPDENSAVTAVKQATAPGRGNAPPDYSKMSDSDVLKAAGQPTLVPVDHDPFAAKSPQLVPVDHNPFDASRAGAKAPVTDPALLAKLNAPDSKPIHIGAPDGSTVEFPAGTSDDTINAAMRKAYQGGAFQTTPAKQPDAAPPDGGDLANAIRSIRDAIHAPTRALENGMLFGLGDRARAGMDAIIGNGSYGADLKSEQGDSDQFAKDHPIAAPVLEGIGNAAAPLGAVAAASKAVGLGSKILLGTGAGGVIGGVQGAANSRDWTDLPQVAHDAGTGAVINGVIGGSLPVAGRVIGAGVNTVTNAFRGRVDGMSRAASGHLMSAVEADGPAAVQARLAELGPDATLTDAGPALLGKTQGASLNSDEGRSILQNTFTNRDKTTNQRIQRDVNGALGPVQGEDPQIVTDRIRRFREEQDVRNYPAALDNAPAVEIAPVMRDLVDKIDQTPVGSMEHKALANLQTMLTKTVKEPLVDTEGFPQYDRLGNQKWQDVPVSHDDANVLHKVKGELDNVIQYDAPGLGVPAGALTRQQASLKQMRFAINDALETQVPGYASANRQSAALAKRMEAVDLGTQYLGNGKTTASPQRFASAFDNLEPGEKIAFAKGSRGNIDRVLGTKANDLQALRGELQGEGGWNTAKLATVHGQPAADALTGTVDRNLKFRDTYNKVVENSQTAQRTAAQKAMKPDPSSETPLFGPGSTMAGMGVTVAKKAVNGLINAVRPDQTRSYGEVARVLSAQGPARDAKVQSIIDALNRRGSNAAASPAVGNSAALLTAMAASDYANRRKQTKP